VSKIEICLRKGTAGSTGRQKANLEALGLRKMNQTVIHDDSPQILGMVKKVEHLVEVKKV
jgi:large subunit ribosomal protein L30